MKEKVIFDTNIIRNTEINSFLGGRDELNRFLENADIVIPEIVIQEIKRQKKQNLTSNKNKFLSNPFHKLLDVNEDTIKDFSIDDYIEKLIEKETISFEVIDIKNNDILPKIKDLALNKKPPFEEKDNTDKGFKDALIYFSVLEYLDEIPNKKVFVYVKDSRLKEAFNEHINIIVIENYEDFKKESVSQFFDDYFIEKVNLKFNKAEIKKEHIVEYWRNIRYNKNVLIKVEDNEYIIEEDSGEIVGYAKKSDFSVDKLVNSRSFEMTHTAIENLDNYINYLSDEDVLNILNASFLNNQIKWIIKDEDVKEFIGTLYKEKSELVEDDVADFLKEEFK